MKPSLSLSAVLAGVLLVTPALAATDAIAGWYDELAAAQQGSGQDTGGRVRADALMRSVLIAAKEGLSTESPPAGASLEAAAAQAAYSTMMVLYPPSQPALDTRLAKSLAAVSDSASAIAAGKKWGEHVTQVVLAEHSDAVFLNPTSFAAKAPDNPPPATKVQAEEGEPSPGRYRFALLAGEPGVKGYADGMGRAARFYYPSGITVDGADNVYVSEPIPGTIRKISPDGVVSTLAGSDGGVGAGLRGSVDGAGAAARFNRMGGLAADREGNVYVVDDQAIRKVDPAGLVTTVAGTPGKAGHVDGPKGSALFDNPTHVAVDDDGNLFVADSFAIRRVTPDGTVSSLPFGSPLDWFGYYATTALCADHSGNLYAIIDDGWNYSEVMKFTLLSSGEYRTEMLHSDPRIVDSAYAWAEGIGVDDEDNLFITYTSTLSYSSTAAVLVRTPTGETQIRYVADGSNALNLSQLAVNGKGNLFVLPGSNWDATDFTVRTAAFDPNANGPVITRQYPATGFANVGHSAQFIVTAAGTPPLTYQWYFNSRPITGATQSTLTLNNVQFGDAGPYHVVVSDRVGSVSSTDANMTVSAADGSNSSATSASAPASSGGGSFDAGPSLAVIGLLAAAASRRSWAQAA